MPTGRIISKGWKFPSTIMFQFQRKKLAYLKYPNMDREMNMESHIKANLPCRFFVRKIAQEISQSTNEVAINMRKKNPEDL